ncbi:ABC transporter permease [Oleiagrimonas sp. MCCC 1A03011]|uniref:ABC transporter permease n=1 Tax=Oleiagrimonas sp. MCCC 1A03011 TaxID=1926883 RepID=UPI000DC5BA08|nr:ABC transporter permease [Oleiagrimonas sp. MCCC 1A03011]RAP58517.1 ABC transporter ATP-binding protein [Oleiagrimonas sp. MCCC 1A03011]
MMAYYVALALRSLKRNKILTALMVLAIAVGIGASMTMLTVLHVLSGNPIPHKSEKLYHVQIDPRGTYGYRPGMEPPNQVTWMDGMNLLQAGKADNQALMTGGLLAVKAESSMLDPFFEPARYTTSGFFPMFDVPFQYGHAWGARDDQGAARVAVISHALNEKLFGGKDSVGHVLRLGGQTFQIVGVLGDWRPNPHFYDLNSTSYNGNEGIYIPLSTSQEAHFRHNGSTTCWGSGADGKDMTRNTRCAWLQFWVQLNTPANANAYRQFLVHYSQQQKALGRFQRPPGVRLRNVMQWLRYNQVVPANVRLQTWLAFGFLLVCLINTVGLMLAKFMRRQGELSVRRAMGASRRTLFTQLLVESGVVGLAGGAGGLLLAMLGLWLVRHRPANYASLAHLDASMLLVTFLLAIWASLLAGLLPAWRACYIAPASMLKSS